MAGRMWRLAIVCVATHNDDKVWEEKLVYRRSRN